MNIDYFGIRHHGPGSAARLVQALEQLQPDCVLVELPADFNALLGYLDKPEMRLPAALLAYAADAPQHQMYYPFAEYSPEYQALRWALQHQVKTAGIDIPAGIVLAARDADDTLAPDKAASAPKDGWFSDPIAALAKTAGYQDGEAWWNDFLEQNHDTDSALFSAVAEMMSVLRAQFPADNEAERYAERNSVREAYMRLQIAAYRKQATKIAVVCGAWHVPGLQMPVTQKEDKAVIQHLAKTLPPGKMRLTWVPWSSARMSQASGYGAGVSAPMWYQHLWDYRQQPQLLEHWLGKIVTVLRGQGQIVSTAAMIEALRLSHALAAVRARPGAGFAEIRDAVIACLCFGEHLLWQQIESEVLLGNQVGEIPGDVPLAPLLEDFQYQQRLCRLKPQGLNKVLQLDLRTESGNRRSVLLHRLGILNVAWGSLMESGVSRGTFREQWHLYWHPEFAVQLVENLIYGNTIEQAAEHKLALVFERDLSLDTLAEQLRLAMVARLDAATAKGLQRLSKQATEGGDAPMLLRAVVPLIQMRRYGTARSMDLTHLQQLIEQMTIQAAVALPYACRSLNTQAAADLHKQIQITHHALLLAELPAAVIENWWHALSQISNDDACHRLIAGLCVRLLYQAEYIDDEALRRRLQKALSPALNAMDSAQYFEGIFTGASEQLQYDTLLQQTVENWLSGLDEDMFIRCLPLLKRAFADLDRMQRQRLLHAVSGRQRLHTVHYHHNETFTPLWQAQLTALAQFLPQEKS